MKLLSLILLCNLAPLAAAQVPEPSDDLVDVTFVVLNDSILTSAMVDKEAARLLVRDPSMNPEDAGSIALVSGVRNMLFQELFTKLGFDDSLLAPRLDARIDQLILEDGSRAGFETSLIRDGYSNIDEFRQDLRRVFIESTVKSVLGGVSPSKSQGLLVLAQPSPEEIRKAYFADASFRVVESQLEWAQLQFFNERGKAPSEDRAAEVANRLGAGLMTPQEAVEAADRAPVHHGVRDTMRQDLVDFLEFAQPGEVMSLGTNANGVTQMILLMGRTEAKDLSFEDSQLTIVNKLTFEKRQQAVTDAIALQYLGSYLWVNPDLPGLEDFLNRIYGGDISASTSAEL